MTESTTNTPEVEAAIQETRDRYKLAFGKDVANSMKNNVEWMNQKIIEELAKKDVAVGDPQPIVANVATQTNDVSWIPNSADVPLETVPMNEENTGAVNLGEKMGSITVASPLPTLEEDAAKIVEINKEAHRLTAEREAKEAEIEAKRLKIATTTSMWKELPVTKKSHAIYKSFMERTGCNILDLTNNAMLANHAPTEEELDAIRREVKRNQTTQIEMPNKLNLPIHIKKIVNKYGILLSRIQDKEFVKEVIMTWSEQVIERIVLEIKSLSWGIKEKREKDLELLRTRMAHEITEIEAYIDHLNNNRK